MKKSDGGSLSVKDIEDAAKAAADNFGSATHMFFDPHVFNQLHTLMGFALEPWQETDTFKNIRAAYFHNQIDKYTFDISSEALKIFYKMGLERSLLK